MPCYDSRNDEYPRIRATHHRDIEQMLEEFLLGDITEEELEQKYRRNAQSCAQQTEMTLEGLYWQQRPPT